MSVDLQAMLMLLGLLVAWAAICTVIAISIGEFIWSSGARFWPE